MKKVLSIALALVMLFALCACDSKDYETAMSLYENGYYDDAKEMFVILGDYEDSAQMIVKCNYGIAISLLKDGDYAAAKELFVALGDYEESTQMVTRCDYQQAMAYMDEGKYKDARELFLSLNGYEDSESMAVFAARYMLVDYIGQNEITKKIDDYSATIVKKSEDDLYLAYIYKMTGLIEWEVKIGGLVDSESGVATIVGTDSCDSFASYYDAEAFMMWDISTYKNGTKLDWEEFDLQGVTAQGKAYTRDATLLNAFLTSAANNFTAHLEQVLKDSKLGLTMADIGFVAY